MNYFKISLGIFLTLSLTRFIPHPPNFTSLIALSFYVPLILGLRFIPVIVISFATTDLLIGYHNLTHYTWVTVILIGFLPSYFFKTFLTRVSGSLIGATLFFLITNFGVWTTGIYTFTLIGLINCYYMAIPFFGYTLLSTIIFAFTIEVFLYLKNLKIINNFFKQKV